MSTLSPAAAIRNAPERSFVHVDRLPGTSAAARKAASRAARDGELVSVRRGLYYKGSRTRSGMTRPRVEEVTREVLGERGVGPAGYSAARALGLTTQLPALWQVATLRTVDAIDGVKQHARRNLGRVDLTEKEIALLEVLRAPEVYAEAGWDAFVQAVSARVSTKEIRWGKVADAVLAEWHVSTRKNFSRLSDSLYPRGAA
jgi:hypothetical protein